MLDQSIVGRHRIEHRRSYVIPTSTNNADDSGCRVLYTCVSLMENAVVFFMGEGEPRRTFTRNNHHARCYTMFDFKIYTKEARDFLYDVFKR